MNDIPRCPPTGVDTARCNMILSHHELRFFFSLRLETQDSYDDSVMICMPHLSANRIQRRTELDDARGHGQLDKGHVRDGGDT
jgi:hypothetical protein